MPESAGEKSAIKSVATIAFGIIIAMVFEYFLPGIEPYIDISSSPTTNSDINRYIQYAVIGVIIASITFILLRVVRTFINQLMARSKSNKNLNGVYILIRITVYAIAIGIFLGFIGVNLQGAIVGGAIGGVVLGLAVQSAASSILSGVLVTAGGFLQPEESISIFSWMFPETITGKVEDVKTLHTRVKLPNGTSILIPNNILFGQAIFTRLNEGNKVKYNLTSTFPADANANEILSDMDTKKEQFIRDLDLVELKYFLGSKNGTTNSINFIFTLRDVLQLNRYIDYANRMVEESYWKIKNKPKS